MDIDDMDEPAGGVCEGEEIGEEWNRNGDSRRRVQGDHPPGGVQGRSPARRRHSWSAEERQNRNGGSRRRSPEGIIPSGGDPRGSAPWAHHSAVPRPRIKSAPEPKSMRGSGKRFRTMSPACKVGRAANLGASPEENPKSVSDFGFSSGSAQLL